MFKKSSRFRVILILKFRKRPLHNALFFYIYFISIFRSVHIEKMAISDKLLDENKLHFKAGWLKDIMKLLNLGELGPASSVG